MDIIFHFQSQGKMRSAISVRPRSYKHLIVAMKGRGIFFSIYFLKLHLCVSLCRQGAHVEGRGQFAEQLAGLLLPRGPPD